MSEGLARRKALRAFGRSLGLKATATGDCGLLDNALTHDSYAFEHGGSRRGQVSNERLEFLGDAVIGLAASAWLFERHPNEPEGWLSRRRQALVSGAALSQTAARIGVGPLLRLGKGEAAGHGERRPSILAGAFEAISGAVLLAEGYDAVARFVQRIHLSHVRGAADADPRTALQELAQARFKRPPQYAFDAESGPAHARVFKARVSAGGVVGTGSGSTKKEAQARAAAEALRKLA
ncbi:MAG TPA: ribonuclease III [Candidatus Eremiobacteraceae bacterium]|nr:ribonuclease III [Candidatus Eremiobacteraceae bacterium]